MNLFKLIANWFSPKPELVEETRCIPVESDVVVHYTSAQSNLILSGIFDELITTNRMKPYKKVMKFMELYPALHVIVKENEVDWSKDCIKMLTQVKTLKYKFDSELLDNLIKGLVP